MASTRTRHQDLERYQTRTFEHALVLVSDSEQRRFHALKHIIGSNVTDASSSYIKRILVRGKEGEESKHVNHFVVSTAHPSSVAQNHGDSIIYYNIDVHQIDDNEAAEDLLQRILSESGWQVPPEPVPQPASVRYRREVQAAASSDYQAEEETPGGPSDDTTATNQQIHVQSSAEIAKSKGEADAQTPRSSSKKRAERQHSSCCVVS